MEQLLHYVWKHRLFPAREFCTTEGEPLEVLSPGLHNTDAGPDFLNARVKMGQTVWAGHVEIHQRSSDWNRHGHGSDAAYNNVILHVVEVADAQPCTQEGRILPQLVLCCPEKVRTNYRALLLADAVPPCASALPHMPTLMLHGWFSRLYKERLQQKAEAIIALQQQRSLPWQDCFFMTLARSFGFGVNSDAFEQWAALLPFRAVDKHRDKPLQVEAVFFGVAGLLDVAPQELFAHTKADEEAVTHYTRLRQEYAYLSHKFQHSQKMPPHAWRLLRLRPDNSPYIRLAQLARLYGDAPDLFSRMLVAETPEQLQQLLQTAPSDYWQRHYSFGAASPRRRKRLTIASANVLIINAVLPVLYAYGHHRGELDFCERAERWMELLPPEQNHVVRKWRQCGITAESAADTQAMIQLDKCYCRPKQCLHCPIGYRYLSADVS